MFDKPLRDEEYPDAAFSDEEEDWEEESEEVDCPRCGASIYEDAVQCPVCGEYVSHGGGPWEGRSPWWIALGLLGVIAVVVALILH